MLAKPAKLRCLLTELVSYELWSRRIVLRIPQEHRSDPHPPTSCSGAAIGATALRQSGSADLDRSRSAEW